MLTDFGSRRRYDSAMAMAVQADGKIVLAGVTDIGTDTNRFAFAVARYNANGTPDATFGNGGQVTVDVGESLAMGADWYVDVALSGDRIILVGSAAATADIYVVQLTANGQLDPTFGTGGIARPGQGIRPQLAVQSDGAIVVSDNFNSSVRVTRLLTDGATDTGFGDAGTASFSSLVADTDASATAVAVDPLGRILVGGFGRGATGSLVIARFTAAGALDPAFGVGGVNTSGTAVSLYADENGFVSLALQPDGKAVLAGTSKDTDWKFAVARFDGDPALLTASLPRHPATLSVTNEQVQPLLAEAVAHWEAAGVNTSSLHAIATRIADLAVIMHRLSKERASRSI
jgi:uncharacterized delta-60 repeat protein